LLVAAKLAVHLATAGRYGYFRDELYFLDCGRHLDWGYVDCAPLVAVYAKVALLLGGSLPVLRSIAALAGAARVALTMLLAREMGGGRFAQALAGLCALAAPIYLGMDSILTMNGFESLFWMGCVYLLVRMVRTGDSRLWLWFGVLAGLVWRTSIRRRSFSRPSASRSRTSSAWERTSCSRRWSSSASSFCSSIRCSFRNPSG